MLGNDGSERGTWRAVTGGTYNFPSSFYGIPASGAAFPTSGTIPQQQTKAGSLSSGGVKVRGVGTTFLQDIYTGDFLYDPGSNTIRKVKYVESDTMLTLEQAFAANVTSIAVFVVREKVFKSIYLKNTGAGASTVNEAPFATGDVLLNAGTPIVYSQGLGTLEITATN